MPYPEQYFYFFFVGTVAIFAAVSLLSVMFYNTLYKKELLSDTFPSRPAKGFLVYLVVGALGALAGVEAAFFDIELSDFVLIIMLPAAVTVCLCEVLNGFIPVIGSVLASVCAILRVAVLCYEKEALWPVLTLVLGGICGVLLMLFINFIAKKTGAHATDSGHIAVITVIFASAGVTPGAVILAASGVLALLTYVLPLYFYAKKHGEPIALSEINYPFTPYLFAAYYAAALAGLF